MSLGRPLKDVFLLPKFTLSIPIIIEKMKIGKRYFLEQKPPLVAPARWPSLCEKNFPVECRKTI